MARVVYACRFDVAGAQGASEVLSRYQDWIVQHYRERHRINGFKFDLETVEVVCRLPVAHSLASSIYQDGGERVVCLRWSFPDSSNSGLRWSNEIRVGQFDDRCGVEHLISVESVDYNVAPARIVVGSPRVIREICSKTLAFVGEMQIRAEPYQLRQDRLNDLLSLLTSDLRKLPVVVLSPFARGEPNQIDPVKLALSLAAIAVVVRIEDPELTWDFTDEIGRLLSCFNGAARIYWPGFSKKSDPRHHHLFLGSRIDGLGPNIASQAIEREIFAVAAFRFVPDRRVVNVIRRVEAIERQELLATKKNAGNEFLESYERDLEKLDEAIGRIQELEAENANLKANHSLLFSSWTDNPNELDNVDKNVELSVSSVAEAVQLAAERCKNLEILESAFAAASESPFHRPYDILEALSDLDDIVNAWQRNRSEGRSGGDLLQHLSERGWGKRSSMHISSTSRGKLRTNYEFTYQGVKQLFEPHITIGAGDANSCASIHFIFDQDRLKIVVGHVGKHLPNTNT